MRGYKNQIDNNNDDHTYIIILLTELMFKMLATLLSISLAIPHHSLSSRLVNRRLEDTYINILKQLVILHLTFMLGKPMPTKKLASQLTRTAMDMAAGLGPCENSSAVIIHGIDPGPTAKNTTKLRVDTTER